MVTVLSGAQVSPSGYPGPQAGPSYPAGHLWGLTLSNGTDATNDINISSGTCRSYDNTADMLLPATITKQLDAAWAAGTNAGGRDTGAIADGTWHVHIVKNLTTTAVDALFSLSPDAPTLPSGFSLFRRVGSTIRTGATIITFLQVGDCFHQERVTAYGSGTQRTLSLLTLTRCPLGIVTFPLLGFDLAFSSANTGAFQVAPGLGGGAFQVNPIAKQGATNATGTDLVTFVSTNLSQQIYLGTTLPVAPTTCNMYQYGYYDNRGKDGYSP